MNVSQYKPSNTMREDAIESLSRLPLIGDAVKPAGKRHLGAGESEPDEAPALELNTSFTIEGAHFEYLCSNGHTCVLRCESGSTCLAVPAEAESLPDRAVD